MVALTAVGGVRAITFTEWNVVMGLLCEPAAIGAPVASRYSVKDLPAMAAAPLIKGVSLAVNSSTAVSLVSIPVPSLGIGESIHSPTRLATIDVNRDGFLDPVTTHPLDSLVKVWIGNSTGEGYAATNSYETGNGPVCVVSGDLNGDGNPDLLTANRDGNSVSVLMGLGDGQFAPVSNTSVGLAPVALAAALINQDDHLDVVVANEGSCSLTVLWGAVTGGFAGSTTLALGYMPGKMGEKGQTKYRKQREGIFELKRI